jgi:epoxyqueuosine reductase
LRNVAVALGNQDAGEMAAESLPALVRALDSDPEALVRGHAAWALGQIGGPEARRALENARPVEQERWVLDEIGAHLNDWLTAFNDFQSFYRWKISNLLLQ